MYVEVLVGFMDERLRSVIKFSNLAWMFARLRVKFGSSFGIVLKRLDFMFCSTSSKRFSDRESFSFILILLGSLIDVIFFVLFFIYDFTYNFVNMRLFIMV